MTNEENTSPPPPVVSVVIITYRHARFIRQCIQGALMQHADFTIEIVIGEDESDDGTREICRELAASHPDRIRLVLNRRADVVHVDGRPRGTRNLVNALTAARGEFVALCEGDDYFTDPRKLAKQVAYLRANPDCVGCFHEASLVDERGAVTQAAFFRPQVVSVKGKYDRRDCITELLSKYATCSLVFRRDAFRGPPDWYMRRSCDFFFDLVITAHGKLGFIDENMAAYRRHGGGVWSSQPRVMQHLEVITRFRMLLGEPEFYPEYREELMSQLNSFENCLALNDDVGEAHRRLAAEEQKVRQLIGERERMMQMLKKQHAIIQGLGKPAGR